MSLTLGLYFRRPPRRPGTRLAVYALDHLFGQKERFVAARLSIMQLGCGA
jgi:hypothetical protein